MPTLNLSDPVIQQAYLEMLSSQYGGMSQQVMDIYNNAIKQFASTTDPSQFGGAPYLQNLLQTNQGAINTQYNNASTNLQDQLSAKGIGGSGIGLAAQNQLQGQRSTALNSANTSAEEQAANYNLSVNQQQLGALQGLLSGKSSADQLNQVKSNQQSGTLSSIFSSLGKLAPSLLTLLSGGTATAGADAGVSAADAADYLSEAGAMAF